MAAEYKTKKKTYTTEDKNSSIKPIDEETNFNKLQGILCASFYFRANFFKI